MIQGEVIDAGFKWPIEDRVSSKVFIISLNVTAFIFETLLAYHSAMKTKDCNKGSLLHSAWLCYCSYAAVFLKSNISAIAGCLPARVSPEKWELAWKLALQLDLKQLLSCLWSENQWSLTPTKPNRSSLDYWFFQPTHFRLFVEYVDYLCT